MIEDLAAESEPLPPTGGSIEGNPVLTSHHALPSLLVREAVQNAWDARDGDRDSDPVLFRIDGWDVDGSDLEALRSLMPVQQLRGFSTGSEDMVRVCHPRLVHEQSSVRILIVSDRRTVGLCGPTRSGAAWANRDHQGDHGTLQPRFANFVRNQGRAADNIGSGDGGSFGVGKSVLWTASACGTVLIHSNTTDEDGDPVARFIGSIRGDHFIHRDGEYTGRHFIGARDRDELIRPLEGAHAEQARRHLKIPSYELDGQVVRGTSIVIIAPRLGLDWKTEMLRFRDAIRWQVWPKLVPGVREPNGGADMRIELSWNGNPVPVPDPTRDFELAPYAQTLLDCARSRNSSEEARDHAIVCGRPTKTLGELKIRRAGPAEENVFQVTGAESRGIDSETGSSDDAIDTDPIVDFSTPWGHIALIRREPLLLVRYEPITGRTDSLADESSSDVGVFLSADDDEVENALTMAEPAAHDDWIVSRVQKEGPTDHRKTFVRMTLKRIREAKRAFVTSLRAREPGQSGGAEQEFSKRLSHGLFGGLGGSRKPATNNKPARGSGRRPSVDLRLVTSRPSPGGTVYELAVEVKGTVAPDRRVTLAATGSARDNTGPMELGNNDVPTYIWTDADGTVTEGDELGTTSDRLADIALSVTVPRTTRFRPNVTLKIHDGETADGS